MLHRCTDHISQHSIVLWFLYSSLISTKEAGLYIYKQWKNARVVERSTSVASTDLDRRSVAKATGGQGGQSAPLTANNLSKMGKRGRKSGKIGKNQEKEKKSGRFLLFAPLDR